jgi:hypothetical protein
LFAPVLLPKAVKGRFTNVIEAVHTLPVSVQRDHQKIKYMESNPLRALIQRHAFFPRSDSKIVFILVMACYSAMTGEVVNTLARAFGAPGPPPGLFTHNGQPTMLASIPSALVLAPTFESLILIGMIEVLRLLAAPRWMQIVIPTAWMALFHSVSWKLWGFIAAPAFAIQAMSYLLWRTESWKVGYGVVVCIHALVNLLPTVNHTAYSVRHA